MRKIKELFHEIGNWHNKISVASGVTKAMLEKTAKENSVSKEVKNMLDKKLTELEKFTLGANEVLIQLKHIVYNVINPDTNKLKVNSNRKAGKTNEQKKNKAFDC